MTAMRRLQDIVVSTNPDDALWTDAAGADRGPLRTSGSAPCAAGRRARRPGPAPSRPRPSADAALDDDRIRARRGDDGGHFSRFHVGGNNAVHGGVIPLFYDWHFGMIVSAADRPNSRTAYLHVDYRKITPIDQPLVSRGRIDSHRRPEGVRHGDDDRFRRQRTIRGQRPDDPAAAPPALRGVHDS